MSDIVGNTDYNDWFNFVREKINHAHLKANLKVNAILLQLYWEIGTEVIKAQKIEGWGAQVIDRLSADIKKDNPENTGFSIRNIKYMVSFAQAYPDFPIVQVPLAQLESEFVQVPLAQITWYHHITLITKVKDVKERAFYIQQTAENGWSRDVMLLQIKNQLYQRSGKALNNFKQSLPKVQSDLAQSIFKDPYQFDFLRLSTKMNEADIEKQLIEKISDFLLELGRGFAYVGKQFKVEIDNTDYKIDLLFYHTILHAYVVIELKAGDFKPEFISKLNFYTSAIDKQIKTENDHQTIGLLLCANKSDVKVEYAMQGLNKPLGVATYELEQLIKDNLKELNKNV